MAAAAATGARKPPSSLRPTFATARAITQTAYALTNKTSGSRRTMALVGVALLVFGLLAMLTNVAVMGISGAVAFGVGAVLLALCLGPKTVGAVELLLALALVLLAAVPWIPWLDDRVFPWIDGVALPWIHDRHWPWPVLLFLLLLPPLTVVNDVARRLGLTGRRPMTRPRPRGR